LDFGFEVRQLFEVLDEKNSLFVAGDGDQFFFVDFLPDANGIKDDTQVSGDFGVRSWRFLTSSVG